MLSPFHSINLNYSMIILMMNLLFSMILWKFYKKILLLVFICYIFMNFLGLVPYSWSPTLFIWGNLFFSLLMWIIYYFYKLMNKSMVMMSYFLPLSSPVSLWSFLIFLEVISQFIRPLTLSLRMTCNLLAGHVILFLMTNLNIFMVSLLLLFEFFVSFIQSYVYLLLLLNYKKESFF